MREWLKLEGKLGPKTGKMDFGNVVGILSLGLEMGRIWAPVFMRICREHSGSRVGRLNGVDGKTDQTSSVYRTAVKIMKYGGKILKGYNLNYNYRMTIFSVSTHCQQFNNKLFLTLCKITLTCGIRHTSQKRQLFTDLVPYISWQTMLYTLLVLYFK